MPEALAGDLRHVSLASVLQLAEGEGHTGVLAVADGTRVALRQGVPVGASRGVLGGRAALLQALVAGSGTFRLVVGEETPEGAPIADLQGAVMDACRLQDELARLRPLRLASVAPPTGDGVADRLRRAMDGDRSVAELLRALAIPEVLAVDPLLAALEAGEVREAAPPRPVAAAPAPADVDEVLTRARAAVRARDFAPAVALFREALALAPGDRVVAQNLARVEQLARSAP